MKILYLTTVGATMGFFECFIKELLEEGHTIDIACNDKISPVPECYKKWGCRIYSLPCSRSPFAAGNIKTVQKIKKLVEKKEYDIVHCHTPIVSVCTRVVCRRIRKNGTKVFYTAHGFHFYSGAPLMNWLFFYPIEKICSRWTDVLITINTEDYQMSKKKFHANHTAYIPGIGIDLMKFSASKEINREGYRKSLGIPVNAFVMVSVGELNKNKNHSVILKAMSLLQEKDIHYVIAGQGTMYDCLLEMAKAFHIEDRVHLLGFRNDVSQLYQMADVCVFPSIREGLGIAAIEGMASGLPLICSNNRGARDYAQNGVNAFVCDYNDVDGFASAIQRLYNAPELCAEFGKVNLKEARRFDIGRVSRIMHSLYNRVG